MARLDNKVAFITGVARGQGRAHAVRMASEGADIVGVDLADELPGVAYDSATLDDLTETVRLVEAQGRKCYLEQADVRDLDRLKEVVDEGVARFGGLDIVVANAGICIPVVWSETTPKTFQDTMDINVTGVWNTVMATAHHLVERGGGSIVLVSSSAGKKMQPFMVPYTTSKHAVTGMTRAFAAELGQHSIRVNSIHPGAVMSPMGSGAMQDRIAETAASYPRLTSMNTPMLQQWAAEPDEIANVVAFLASDESKFMSAEHVTIDGGAQYF
ncbi:mycofactocin-coupled SDR family oxidoreductase [Rhodococcus fascians]|nr:mycofactocin-coupled SDR family oxidoreductase [Rhodococcus fascians]MBY4140938.1 mycofactocin-coupled SDR family oxidoreductase [Rhodococcus fascians]MBY4219602.1 mycofactocin-coupled SDR family oxidoreductase [Rhodococcus fascians]MBY4221911.1 mycofactocin-coupled SDR family oxidoreductase [Rhodococcus fascians]MBY4233912.1 mycofactocin-coupled SDR family oxidoreductase [Rhodococcus fascians]